MKQWLEKISLAAFQDELKKIATAQETASIIGGGAAGAIGYDIGRHLLKKAPVLGSAIGAAGLALGGHKLAKYLFKKKNK